MTEKEIHPTRADDLRRKAEEVDRERAFRSRGDDLPQDIPTMLHELRVHQIELEMQNTLLQQRQEELDAARARYFDLYEMAPVGYITVSPKGLIIEANLTAATMLGMVRGGPGHVHPIFSHFIHIDDQDIYYWFRKQLLATGKPQACELRMVKKDGPAFWAHLEAAVAQNTDDEPLIRVVISDITDGQKLKEANILIAEMVEEQTKQLRQQTEAKPAEGANTILLVDDEPHVLSALTRTLRNSPYQLLTAENAVQALEIMETTSIKVIVSDEQMPGMKGAELLAEVKRRFPHTMRILLTGQATLEASMRALNERQVYRFLIKPWDEGMLRLALSAATEKYNSAAEKRRWQEALRESEQKHKRMISNISDVIAVMDKDGTLKYKSPNIEKWFGWQPEDLVGTDGWETVHPDDLERIQKEFFTLLDKDNSVATVEYRYKCKDGSYKLIELTAVNLTNDPLINGVLMNYRDITGRKQAEEYREMRQEVLSILNDPEDLPDSMQRVLTVLKVRTGCNAVAIRLQEGEDFPYFAQEGFSDDFLRTENMLISRAADGQMCRDKEGNVRLECTCGLVIDGRTDPSSPFFTPGGSFWTNDSFPLLDLPSYQDPRNHPRNQCIHHGYASFVLVPLRNKGRGIGLIQVNDGRKGYFTIEMVEHLERIAAHIGAALVRRQAEKALQEAHDLLEQRVEERTKQLQESEARLQLAISTANVGIFEFDVVNNRLTWDATMYRFYGITPDQFGGVHRAWEDGVHPDDLSKVQSIVQQALSGERDFDTEFRVVWPDGSIHFLKAKALIHRDPEGRPLRVTGMNLDVTADKLQLEAAEAASLAKTQFISNMSHELRTPLNGVLGMTDLLLSTPLIDKQRNYAGKIKKSGEVLLVLISDILDFSKLDAGKMALESTPFLVEALIANVISLFGPSAAQEKIGLYTAIDPAIPALRGDSQRLTQVVSNLVGNAVKFTKAGEIRVAVKILRQTEAKVDLEISVQDTGIGMTKEEISRVFAAFTQADDSNTRRYGGGGLGLAISRNLVELMGGTLKVESVLNKGSVFTILVSFPIAQGFARSDLKSASINPTAPARPELPPGDMAELQPLLEQLRKPLASREPLPCKKILAALLQKKWPAEQETLLLELNRLVNLYRLPEALAVLKKYEAGGD